MDKVVALASKPVEQIPVSGKDGLRAMVDADQLDEARFQPGAVPQVLLRLENGTRLLVPADLLEAEEGGSFYLPFSMTDLLQMSQQTQMISRVTNSAEPTMPMPIVASIPVIVEEAAIEKREVEAGKVLIHKSVSEREQVVDEPLLQESIEVKRVLVNEMVDAPVPVRYEGDTMIISLLEEVLVVEKRLMVREEVHVIRKQTETHTPQTVTLRSEDVSVERVPANEDQLSD
jgi:uncharacterized protein (TIGR02271 family)